MLIEKCVITFPKRREKVSEDCHVDGRSHDGSFFAAVVDGHGAEHLHQKIVRFTACATGQLAERFVTKKDMFSFPEIFTETDRQLTQEFGGEQIGAVATCVVIEPAFMTIAQVGDCRVMQFDPMWHDGLRLITRDHNCENPLEYDRLRPLFQTGTFRRVCYGPEGYTFFRLHRACQGMPLVSASLAMTRGFGNAEFRPAFIQTPEIRSVPFHDHVTTLFALCSDGGAETVRKTFKFLKKHAIDVSRLDTSSLEKIARRKSPLRPDDDVTAIFLKVSP
ncbi:MAG: PP2C family protein-serine/threonine phosphatase [Patescibacteria group bacterium]